MEREKGVKYGEGKDWKGRREWLLYNFGRAKEGSSSLSPPIFPRGGDRKAEGIGSRKMEWKKVKRFAEPMSNCILHPCNAIQYNDNEIDINKHIKTTHEVEQQSTHTTF